MRYLNVRCVKPYQNATSNTQDQTIFVYVISTCMWNHTHNNYRRIRPNETWYVRLCAVSAFNVKNNWYEFCADIWYYLYVYVHSSMHLCLKMCAYAYFSVDICVFVCVRARVPFCGCIEREERWGKFHRFTRLCKIGFSGFKAIILVHFGQFWSLWIQEIRFCKIG